MIHVLKNIQLLFFLFIVLVFVILIAVIFYQPEEEEEEQIIEECSGGSKSCMKGPCNGTQTCINGTWGKCTVDMICTPGAREPCVVNHCVSAYKICNDCGTGYGECIGKNGS